jgi:Holliday junction DNA helicase RuvA
VREDAQKLYGFFTKSERELFKKLIGISMIGPKVALSVLSGLSVRDIISAIQTADVSRLKSISGVGLKTAQRILVELKGKLDAISAGESSAPVGRESGKTGAFYSLRNDAYAALVSLGYNESQVVNALVRVEQTLGKDAPVEEWIKKALKVI